MTRGNQRDLARAKNQKKQQEMQKKKNASEKTGMSLQERKHREAKTKAFSIVARHAGLICTMTECHQVYQDLDVYQWASKCNRLKDAELMREKQRKKEQEGATNNPKQTET